MTDFKQDAPMDVYPIRLTAAHARLARKKGNGNLSQGVRKVIEQTDSDLPYIGNDRRKKGSDHSR